MKRHIVLHPLSHDHQNVLARALRLRKAADGDEDARRAERASFAAFVTERVEPHFVEEERFLERALALEPGDEELAFARDRVLEEHADLREAFAALRSDDGAPSGSELRDLGERVTAHVRYEEREVFEMLQERLGDRIAQLAP